MVDHGVERQPMPRNGGLTATAWLPGSELELGEWLQCGRRLGTLGRGIGWWIGDWLLYGNAHYGERYARAARVTGYDVQSLMNMVYVASRFTSERRRATLSWSHHAEVAALSPIEQDRWLDSAEQERMSVRSLRTELQSHRRARRQAGEQVTARTERGELASSVTCPHCKSVIELQAAHAKPPTRPRLFDADRVGEGLR